MSLLITVSETVVNYCGVYCNCSLLEVVGFVDTGSLCWNH